MHPTPRLSADQGALGAPTYVFGTLGARAQAEPPRSVGLLRLERSPVESRKWATGDGGAAPAGGFPEGGQHGTRDKQQGDKVMIQR